ncbi:primosomal protein DnaI [Shouchella lonarensis]|uniref:Replicative DNA helicase loader DnaI n=1 Tax=Shouchella lonarensis TaxID=1464122 RepID=A0A1G6GP46_9BACI|nr:primosomal protein DnaI [Shouchella lonarensis]SDB83718.1 replicative DNA helicase loader DnaI [Shouchella lonarensis]
MESIKHALSSWDRDGTLAKRLEEQQQRLLQHKGIQSFLKQHPDVTRSMIERGLSKLYEYEKEQAHCDACPGLEACPNMMTGYTPHLYVERGHIALSYTQCPLKGAQVEAQAQQALIQSLYIPKDVLKATFDNIDQDGARQQALTAALRFVTEAQPGKNGRGLYLCGPFGVGKTYLLGAIANDLKDKHIKTCLIYTPDFFREMKQAIGDGSVQEKLENIRKVPVLMFDDIGAETTTAWTRDEVLGPILQYRMSENLPTLFTSNYNYNELEEALSYSDKGGIERLKAKRLMERIKHFTTFVEVRGRNRRTSL